MVEFKNQITIIKDFLVKNNFRTGEVTETYANFISDYVCITIGYDWRDNSTYVTVGNEEYFSIGLDVVNLFEVFGFNIEYFIKTTTSDFLIHFLNNEGQKLLTRDSGSILSLLNENQNKRAEEYTKDLLKRQALVSVDRAWAKKDFQDFISHFAKLDIDTLPKSYLLKYEIAKKNTSNLNAQK